MAALRQCKIMSPFSARGPSGLKPGDLLNPLRGSKEPLFHICAGAEGVIRNDPYAKLDPAQVSVLYFVPASADPWKSGHSWPRCGNAKECRPLGPGACRAKAGRSIESLRGSKEPLFHICAGAEGGIRNDHCAILKIRAFL